MKKLVFPFPEMIDDCGWKIQPGAGATAFTTDPSQRRMAIPLGKSEFAKAIRFHELLHIQWSPHGDDPVMKMNARESVIQSVEDYRISYKAQVKGIGDDLRPLVVPEEIPGMLKTCHHHDGSTNVGGLACQLLSISTVPGMKEVVLRCLQDRISDSWDSGLEKNAIQMEAIHQIITIANQFIESQTDLSFLNVTKRIAEWLEKQIAMVTAKMTPGNTTGDKPEKEPLDETPCNWVPMDVKHPVLTRYRVFDSKGTKKRAKDTGDLFRYPQRYCVDKAVFSEHRAKKGGTILVDVSYSMMLSLGDIEKILKMAPAATVATYCGCASQKKGEVTIVGKNGQRVKKFNFIGDHNLIDGPALKWLSRQKTPRLWITDGKVTGLSPTGNRIVSKSLREECNDLCRYYRIAEVSNLAEAEKRLARFA